MEEHLSAIRDRLEEMLRERDTVKRPEAKDHSNMDAFDAELSAYIASKNQRREAAMGEHLRGAFRALETLATFFSYPPEVLDPAPPTAEPPSEREPVVQPEGVRARGRKDI